MYHPRTAIIVLTYNGLDTTKKFLKDLYDNTERFLLIIIDNGSTDDSPEYLGNFAEEKGNVVFSANDENLFIIGGRNYGYEIYDSLFEKPDYLMFLDNDQFVQPGWLQHHHDVMAQSKAHIVGVEGWLLNKNFRPVKKCDRPTDPWSYVGCGGMMMERAVPESIGMFDPIFDPFYFEDPDYCFRALDADFRIAWNYKAKLVHQAHQTLGKNPARTKAFLNSHTKFYEKWKGRKALPQIQHKVPALR